MSAKPARWYLNAARRTVTAAVPSLARPDDAWALTRLEAAEAALYLRLPAPERVHAIDVARCVLRERPDAHQAVVR